MNINIEDVSYEELVNKLDVLRGKNKKNNEILNQLVSNQLTHFEESSLKIKEIKELSKKYENTYIQLTKILNSSTSFSSKGSFILYMRVLRNLRDTIERLNDYVNLTSKLSELENLLKDDNNIPLILKILFNILEIKDRGISQSLFGNQLQTVKKLENDILKRLDFIFKSSIYLINKSPNIIKQAFFAIEQFNKFYRTNNY